MSEARAFQDAFGAALEFDWPPACGDPAMARAIAVHRNTSVRAALDALGDNYPVVRAMVADEAFFACAGAYVKARPPRDPRLCVFGDAFAEHLRDYAPFASAPYLGDVAELERRCVEALFAADAPVLRGEDFAGGVDPGVCLSLHPAVRFAAFAHPAVSLWLAHQDDAPANALESLVWSAETALVTRPADALQVVAVDGAAVAFLTACARDGALGAAALAAARTGGDVAQTFAALIGAGAFTSMTPGDLS
jgi:hypothetical protein